MQIKTFVASSPKKLDRLVNEFLADPTVEVLTVDLSSNAFTAWVLVQYRIRPEQ